MIWTFYSAERGVGRSMAMANVAEVCRRAGDRVIVADWDLEAPGLERLFPAAKSSITSCPGVIDLLTDYKSELLRPISNNADDVRLPTSHLDSYLTIVGSHAPAPAAELRLMPAGRRDSGTDYAYVQRVTAFDWSDFFAQWGGQLFFHELRHRLMDAADLVLIDSSAGFSTPSSVCTSLLADVVVLFCAGNTKSLDRTLQTAQQLLSPSFSERRTGRPLALVVVPSRINYDEADLLNEFKRQFLSAFSAYVPPQFGGAEAFWKLRIPHIPYFAHRESIVIERPDEAISEPLVEAYQRLADTLNLLRPERRGGASGESRELEQHTDALASFRTLRARKTETPTVFISYAREDETQVRTLYRALIDAGFKAWLDKENLHGGEDWERVIEERIEQSDLVLVCLSKVAVTKRGFVQREIKKTLELVDLQPEGAVYLIPVRLDDCEIPRSLGRFNCIDLFEEGGRARLEDSIRVAWRQSRTAKL
jgi:MinD-like ATPase involved in chromosome partitioning or flagellar assembly